MTGSPAALIFDMDGVLINSEPLWRKAMIAGFREFGMTLSEEECRSTMGMRFREVIQLWLGRFRIIDVEPLAIERRVEQLLIGLIETEGKMLNGISEIIDFCSNTGIPMGIATSSSAKLMETVVRRLGIAGQIPHRVSAENLTYAKPHPKVFLVCAKLMNTDPRNCVVIEDSVNGVIAARAAGMLVIAVPDDEHFDLPQFVIAHHFFRTIPQAVPLIKELFTKTPSGRD